ncbi:DUF1284 domain-containing protein [Clostridium cylindrosporum]|uniref:DUF1284 domain-containing protein n=1 Tax=Clostridium cylindrosporum DSM 605 TaxID=1121307 RepID=A0A0J8D9G2_CLOCY|nr:DUF1284 domain-containing protein [Clostridium cylindrosporum]KMT20933.1 hypothetical protein CLCY_1c01670 [Clostridium cylindrosporum DSM 605]
MLKLRPHHIVCLNFYKGIGYSENFVSNMDLIVNKIKNNPETKILICSQADDICKECPHLQIGKCTCEDNISKIDKNASYYLNLEVNSIYKYNELVKLRNKYLTKANFEKICKDCQWYKDGVCK